MPVKFEQNLMVRTTRNFELLEREKKNRFFITQFDKELTPFWKTFQVKNCTKHGRPDQS